MTEPEATEDTPRLGRVEKRAAASRRRNRIIGAVGVALAVTVGVVVFVVQNNRTEAPRASADTPPTTESSVSSGSDTPGLTSATSATAESSPEPTATSTPAPDLLVLGDDAVITLPGGSEVRVETSAPRWHSDGEPAPAEGRQYLVFDMTLTHLSGPPADIAPSQLTVRWEQSARPNTGPTTEAGGHVETPFTFDTLQVGGTATGQVAFELPSTEYVVLRLADTQGQVLARWSVPPAA